MCSRMRWEYPGKQGKPPSSWSQKTPGTDLEKNQTSELKRTKNKNPISNPTALIAAFF